METWCTSGKWENILSWDYLQKHKRSYSGHCEKYEGFLLFGAETAFYLRFKSYVSWNTESLSSCLLSQWELFKRRSRGTSDSSHIIKEHCNQRIFSVCSSSQMINRIFSIYIFYFLSLKTLEHPWSMPIPTLMNQLLYNNCVSYHYIKVCQNRSAVTL